ncbi:carboxypeptidase-like regulatory domain-containing protein [Thomasclavelia cocleata]|uniref:carboxypeptidase-like regulatory domain-containing protein n=2 Tax=Thomasclavelia cocleata TaxID=69824 RepID=UPI00260E7DC6|nr:carboxypeptidase-like regulatory domain-containing protein [Thomasclavelia cocleata]
MKKILGKVFSIFTVFLMVISITTVNVFAETSSQDGLEVITITDKESYKDEDKAIVVLSIKNTNGYDMKDVEVNISLPEQLSSSEKTAFNIPLLKANEIKEYKVIVERSDEKVTIKPSEDNPNDINSSVNTGDISPITGLIGIAGLSLFSILFLKKKNKLKKVMVLTIISSMVVSSFSISSVNAQTSHPNTKEIKLTQNVKFGNNTYPLDILVRYTMENGEVVDEGEVTREQWITKLVDNLQLTSEFERYSFDDFDKANDASKIETAIQHGIIDLKADEDNMILFSPNDYATREFVAVTVANAMGYVNRPEVKDFCFDMEQLKYPSQDYIAISDGYLQLIDNMFYPNKTITLIEINHVLEVIKKVNDSANIGDNPHENIEYAEGVLVDEIQGLKYSIFENKDGTYIVELPYNEQTKKIKNETAFVLPETEDNLNSIALVATQVIKENDNLLKINASKPNDVSKILKSIDFEGIGTEIDEKNIECFLDGVEFYYDSSDELQARKKMGGSIFIPGKIKINFGDGYKLTDKVKLCGKVEIKVPNVTARLNAKFNWFNIDVKEFTLSITEKATIEGGIEAKIENSENVTHGSGTIEKISGSKEIGRVSVRLNAELSIDFVFSVTYTATGEAKINYTIESTQGFQYKNGNFRNLCDMTQKFKPINIAGKGNFGIELGANLTALKNFDLVGFDIQSGPAFDVTLEPRLNENPPLICADTTLFLYAKWELTPDTMLATFLKNVYNYVLEESIWDKNNSIFRKNYHFENWNSINNCTYGSGKLEGHVHDVLNDSAISGAVVEIWQDGDKKNTVKTDNNGYYKFRGLLPGTYILKVKAKGYDIHEQEFNIVKGDTTYLSLKLNIKDNIINKNGIQLEVGKSYRFECLVEDKTLISCHKEGSTIEYYIKPNIYNGVSMSKNMQLDENNSSDISTYPIHMRKGDLLDIKLLSGELKFVLDENSDGVEDVDDFYKFFKVTELNHNPLMKINLSAGDVISLENPSITGTEWNIRYYFDGNELLGSRTAMYNYWGNIEEKKYELNGREVFDDCVDEGCTHTITINRGTALLYMWYEDAKKLIINK